MKNNLLVFCTIVNVLVTLIALIFVYKVDVTWTGSLGDTFGGLLSPVIGGVSIYFIYRTFAAQRKQLQDQIAANRVTVGTLHLEKIDSLINTIQEKSESYKYISSSSLHAFSQKYNIDTERMYKKILPQDLNLINEALNQANQVSFLITLFLRLKEDMSEEYCLVAESRIKLLLTDLMRLCCMALFK